MRKIAFLLIASIALAAGPGCEIVSQALGAIAAFTQFIKTGESIIGTGFIAEGQIYTAAHVADAAHLVGVPVGPDIVRIGAAPLRGYTICRRGLVVGEKLHIDMGPWPNAPRIEVIYNGAQELRSVSTGESHMFGVMNVGSEVWPGVSGSPVLTEQGEVVGCVSMRTSEPRWALFSPFDLKRLEALDASEASNPFPVK